MTVYAVLFGITAWITLTAAGIDPALNASLKLSSRLFFSGGKWVLSLGVVALLILATNPYALLFALPALHAWLWLPQVQTRHPSLRASVFLAGFAGPAYLIWTFATHLGLGWDAPWYLAKLFAVGYAPLPVLVIGLGWLAVAGQLAALAAGRYAPYPAPQERSRRGPIRELIRTLLLAQQRRAAGAEERRAINE